MTTIIITEFCTGQAYADPSRVQFLTRDGQNWLAFHMQVSCRRVWSTTHSGVGS